MCHYPYVAVEFDDAAFDAMGVRLGFRRVDAGVVAAAASAGLKLTEPREDEAADVARFVSPDACVYTMPVGGCACDWGAGQFEIARRAVLAILASEPVRAVTWAFLATGIEPHEVNRIEAGSVEFATMNLGRDDCVRVVNRDADETG